MRGVSLKKIQWAGRLAVIITMMGVFVIGQATWRPSPTLAQEEGEVLEDLPLGRHAEPTI